MSIRVLGKTKTKRQHFPSDWAEHAYKCVDCDKVTVPFPAITAEEPQDEFLTSACCDGPVQKQDVDRALEMVLEGVL